jgi:hypothetical protein
MRFLIDFYGANLGSRQGFPGRFLSEPSEFEGEATAGEGEVFGAVQWPPEIMDSLTFSGV